MPWSKTETGNYKVVRIAVAELITAAQINAQITDNAEQQPDEWQCSYCGRPNHRKRQTCQSCGAVRPFVYAAN